MATCSYCGNEVYNCTTCPGVLDSGVDLEKQYDQSASSTSSGCELAPGHAAGVTPVVGIGLFAGMVWLRRRSARNAS